MRRIVSLASVAALAVAALPAQSAVWDHLCESYDKNGDGKVVQDEYPRGEDKFARFDRDGDGVLTASDFERGRGGRAAGRRRARGQGQVRPASQRGGMGRWTQMVAPELGKAADLDRSGTVPPEEWKAFLASLEASDDGVIEPTALSFLKGGGRMASMAIRMFDLDRDGDLTIDDLGGMFATLDGNEDGTLQRDELGELPIPGDTAPGFVLPFADDKDKTVDLASFRGKKHVALIFGSYT